jgi:hypothetical protein
MEIRRLADESILEFTNKMEAVFNQLSARMESNRHTSILGRASKYSSKSTGCEFYVGSRKS